MRYSGYELLWIFMVCSIGGWCGEVIVSAVRRHKFINRGFVSGPICPIYGVSAAAFAVFLPELKEHLFFLFLGGLIIASVIEYFTGWTLERFFQKKWWDYSDRRFHLDGYICLETSVLWGLLAVFSIWWLFPLVVWIVARIPDWIHLSIAWVLGILLLIDYAGSFVAIQGLKRQKKISHITEEQGESNTFAQGYSFYKLVSLFFIGSVIGDLVETVFMYLTTHKWVSRTSVVYGHFSVVWGLGCVMLTMILYQQKEKGDRHIFIAGTLLGGAYEYICSVLTELVFGTVFWDYSKLSFNLGGRINLLYCFFWGVAAVIWMKGIYPFLSFAIEKNSPKSRKTGM